MSETLDITHHHKIMVANTEDVRPKKMEKKQKLRRRGKESEDMEKKDEKRVKKTTGNNWRNKKKATGKRERKVSLRCFRLPNMPGTSFLYE